MAEVIPTHTHAVVDADRPFVIDPNTMEVTSRDANLKLPQHSKNAEVFTFTLSSSVVEGHDLATCNSVKVHYENVDSKTGKISAGLYTVSDFSVSENGVKLSWVVDDDATRYVGALLFSIHFSCFDEDGALVYNLPTLTYSKITVGATVWLSDTIEREYPDIVAEFERRLSVIEKAPAVLCSPQVLSPEKKAQARFNIKACDAGIITGTSDTLTWDGNRDGVFSYFMYSKVSDVVPSVGIEDFANGCSMKVCDKDDGVTEAFYDSSDVTVNSRGIIVIGFEDINTNYPQSNLGSAAIVPRDYYAEDGTIELEKGVYFYDMRVVGFDIYGISLTIPGYTGFGRQQLDPALLPDSVATKEYVDAAVADNPPMNIGVEYRTRELWDGYPVYAKLIDFGNLPNKTEKQVSIGFPEGQVISIVGVDGTIYNHNDKTYIGLYAPKNVTVYVTEAGAIVIYCETNRSNQTAKIIIKYIKH